ncbi:MAG TPA: response regulator [Chitinophagaceae bacterium]
MILIVDDQKENIFSLKSLLELNKFKVDTACSGEEALKKILKNTYALIVLDVQMPGMDGFEVAEAISGYSKARDIPIIFLSAVNTDKKFITRGYTSGGIDYVTKPFDSDLLLLKVKNFYRLSEQNQKLNTIQKALEDEIEFRKKAENQLQALNQLLEQKVAQRTDELQKSNIELEASNHELQQYASIASHDLKEPLRKIQVFGNLIRDRFLDDNEEGLSYMNRVITASERMTSLINDLLSYSRLSVDSLFHTTNMKEVIENILFDMELIIQERGAIITIGDIPPLEVIPGQMRQVFQNIISNALKFFKKDIPPVIEIKAETVAEKAIDALPAPGGGYCRISIRDNGIGFNEIYLDKIFTIFQRLNSREEYEGTGIGLAIVKKIIDKHNGIISARSTEGGGSTFIMVLPIRQQLNSSKQ